MVKISTISNKEVRADTHSLLWAFHKPAKLGAQARRAFQEITDGESKLLIPVIVPAELILTFENKPVGADLDRIIETIRSSPNVGFIDFDFETALKLSDLTAIPEMHDRIIVAAAIENDARLITFDKIITASGLVDIVR